MCSDRDNFGFTFKNIKENLSKLNIAIDKDNVHTYHLKYATDDTILFITHLFNSFIKHCFLPPRLLEGKIRPIIKNKIGNFSDSNNYRPIMISSNFLKLFEYCIQPFLEQSLCLHNNQFGFRKQTSTQMTVAVVKEVISNYNNNNSDVFAGFLDLNKGFDKVNHFKLLEFLWDTSLNSNLKLIMHKFLLNQSAYISYNNLTSNVNHIGNGVRQGAINSPLLFNFYLSHMVKDICSSKVGCKLGLSQFPLICYADDLIALAPSQSALQFLLNKMASHLNKLSLSANPSKTKIVVFSKGTSQKLNHVNLYLNGVRLDVVKSFKYLGVVLSSDSGHSLDIERLAEIF